MALFDSSSTKLMSNEIQSRLTTHLLFTKTCYEISEATSDYEKSKRKIKVNGNPLVALFCLTQDPQDRLKPQDPHTNSPDRSPYSCFKNS